jgi:hypothetical protein
VEPETVVAVEGLQLVDRRAGFFRAAETQERDPPAD